MNRKRMKALANALEQSALPVKFSMLYVSAQRGIETSLHVGAGIDCDTTCCIAGLACLLFGKAGMSINTANAQNLLDLSDHEADALFYNRDGYISSTKFVGITKKQAAAAIRQMAT